MKRILCVTNIPSPYSTDFYNQIGKDKNISLTVVYEQRHGKDREWVDKDGLYFNSIYLRGIRYSNTDTISFELIKYIRKFRNDTIILSNYSSVTEIIAILYMKYHKINFAIHVDGGIVKNESYLRYLIKRWTLGKASFWFSSGKFTTNYIMHYTKDSNNSKVWEYPFTSVFNNDIRENIGDKDYYRKKLGLDSKKIVVSVSQIIERKGVDVLLRAKSRSKIDYSLYILGGKPDNKLKKIMSDMSIDGVYFLPFLSSDKVYEYMRAADVFALMTREDIWGLVINEAMANALPVVTTFNCVAGVEMINSGTNGYLVKSEDYCDAADKIDKILESEELQKEMAYNCLCTAREYTVEKMVESYKCGIELFMSKGENTQTIGEKVKKV